MDIQIEDFKRIRRKDCLEYSIFDSKYGTDTGNPLRVSMDGRNEICPGEIDNTDVYYDSQGYQTSALGHIDIINNFLKENIDDLNKYSFVDIGCGKGRVIIQTLFTNNIYKDYCGIEIDKEIYTIFKKNINAIKSSVDTSKVKIILQNALDYQCISVPTVYFLFEPFGSDTYIEFFKNNKNILENNDTIIVNISWIEKNIQSVENLKGFTNIYKNFIINIYKN
ncbi:AdoMet_MTases domain containing protein [uncultured Caudovirales phage]|uniref:AdoMet_MTases domain containing protein n=1 Tax=uncultured Caudovirales phage TaxID=2100421 RepID=A0A6J5PRQ0_9CAUD|nr:AdoMet_MTases domain containing protein [uncultured Caudovirales phage]CAB4151107.1 AdoMet_MTases domain containing protein [uncultured Caudovirales phage]CAB4173842.1 AdoMet_MTases domain containing protein [uncultured Caudovirales phage]CAB4179748.1 AdoMet_MTases domain containing protein [uncultured Caudovirales phage]CAB4185880.1 AdoMet_MTases domain containing protein [uncultured Caudovirales phage]